MATLDLTKNQKNLISAALMNMKADLTEEDVCKHSDRITQLDELIDRLEFLFI